MFVRFLMNAFLAFLEFSLPWKRTTTIFSKVCFLMAMAQ